MGENEVREGKRFKSFSIQYLTILEILKPSKITPSLNKLPTKKNILENHLFMGCWVMSIQVVFCLCRLIFKKYLIGFIKFY